VSQSEETEGEGLNGIYFLTPSIGRVQHHANTSYKDVNIAISANQRVDNKTVKPSGH
jgi:hypothetical protein